MPLKAKLTKEEFEELPEATREYYKANGEGYLLDAEGVEDVSGLKSALQKERDERAAAKKALEAFKDIDPEKYQQLLSDAEQREHDNLKKSGKYEELKAKLTESHNAEKAKLQAEIDKREARIRKFVLEDQVRSEAIKAGVVKDLIDDVVVVTGSRFKLDDNEKIQVLDKDGSEMGITVESFFTDVFKEQRPHYYAASGAGGSGAPPGTNGGGNGVIRLKREDVKNNPALYEQAKERAAKSGGEVQFAD